MTKKDIRDKYNIVCLERPERANKELSNGEAKKYEKNQKLLMKNFTEYCQDDYSGDID